MADYALPLYDQFGSQLADLTGELTLDYTLAVNGLGVLNLTLPPIYDSFLFAGGSVIRDNRLQIYRSLPGNVPYLEGQATWLVRAGQQIEQGGKSLTRLQALHANDLLNRRIVAYNSGSSEADKGAGPADNRMKAIVRENLGALATDTARDISTYLQVQADSSQGASISKAFARRNVLAVLQEYALASTLAGTYLAFDTVALTPALSEFRTYIGQRGTDRRFPSGVDPVLIGPEYGNTADAVLDFNCVAEKTYVYAGGQGEGAARAIGTASDAARLAASPLNRLELFVDSRMTDDAAQLADEADAALRNARPRILFSARLVDTPAALYGRQYNYGDYLTVQYRGQAIDCRLDTVHVHLEEGQENVDCYLRAEL